MAEKSKIEWLKDMYGRAGATWNPIRGNIGKWHCTKVNATCRFCYAERINKRFGGPAYRLGADTLRLDEAALQLPARWARPRRVFPCSMTDLFHENVPYTWINEVFRAMAAANRHIYIITTKRPARMEQYFYSRLVGQFLEIPWNQETGAPGMSLHWPAPNIHIGLSIGCQDDANAFMPYLARLQAAVRWVSYEPAIGPVNWEPWAPYIDWLVSGGESGSSPEKSRPSHPDWHRAARDTCRRHGIPYFFKQWGNWIPTAAPREGVSEYLLLWPDGKIKWVAWEEAAQAKRGGWAFTWNHGKNGAMLDLQEHTEYPIVHTCRICGCHERRPCSQGDYFVAMDFCSECAKKERDV